MAIYHASFQVVKRSAGRSSVAAAAYRSGERLTDERTNEIHDYTRRAGVASTFIMTPSDAPEWAADRDKLWSAVELGEKRKDAQLARELNVALPRELSQSESTQLLKEYVQESFVDKGMVADVCIHDMKSENPHAHVMLTMREIDADGFGPKNRDWNSKDQLAEWRQGWEQKTNQHLELAGHDERIDHRSLLEQGVERVPTVHLGPKASAMEKRGIRTVLGDINRRVVNLAKEFADVTAEIAAEKKRQFNEKLEKSRQEKLQKTPRQIAMEAVRAHSKSGSVLNDALKTQKEKQIQEREKQRERESLERSRNSRGLSL